MRTTANPTSSRQASPASANSARTGPRACAQVMIMTATGTTSAPNPISTISRATRPMPATAVLLAISPAESAIDTTMTPPCPAFGTSGWWPAAHAPAGGDPRSLTPADHSADRVATHEYARPGTEPARHRRAGGGGAARPEARERALPRLGGRHLRREVVDLLRRALHHLRR